jgi:hypothetical protein
MTEPTLTAEEHPDSPSLSDWHTLYTAVLERFPDAPVLPQRYLFVPPPRASPEDGLRFVHWTYNLNTWFPKHAALCVMLDWATRFGAWWESSAEKNVLSVYSGAGGWSWWSKTATTEKRGRGKVSHHAAYFAAVQAIGE